MNLLSRYSSFGHSHSDSLELHESMFTGGRRDPSLELNDARGGSFSSEDSTPLHPKQRASSLDIRDVIYKISRGYSYLYVQYF
jgi:hypothetical protein